MFALASEIKPLNMTVEMARFAPPPEFPSERDRAFHVVNDMACVRYEGPRFYELQSTLRR